MTRYSLDANAVIAMLRDRTGLVATRARQHAQKDLGVSVIVYHELAFGAYKSVLRDRNARAIAELPFDIMPLDIKDARRAAELRAALAAIGRPIGPYDTMIAGQALARDLILVSANVGEFSRVPGLRLENWAAP